MCFYRVTETFYEDPSRSYDYGDDDGLSPEEALVEAKKHVDDFYKRRTDSGDHCYITRIQNETDVNYQTPWKNPRFKNLMSESKEKIIGMLIGIEKEKKIETDGILNIVEACFDQLASQHKYTARELAKNIIVRRHNANKN